jgi:hypothetical protein
MEGNRNIDWFYQQLSGAVDCDNSGEFVDILQRAKETGESFGLDLNCEDKDGYFDYNQFYAVWDKEDVSQLVEKLKECLLMPNFTEGEWEVSGTVIWVPVQVSEDDVDQMPIAEAATEPDARLMAQSKKMYSDVLRKLDAWWRLPNAERTIENIEPIMRSTLAILSEIDKE